MKIVFMGTPDFAVPSLKKLIDFNYDIVAVFTQPDKRVGRKQILTPPPVKEFAVENNIPVYQPHTLKDGKAFDIIKNINPEIIIVIAYGKILPKEIIDFPKYGCINVHASLLPKYRGAAPIQHAVLNGDSETGVSIMKMDEGIDTGDIFYTEKTLININETSAQLFERLSKIGANALVKTIKLIECQKITSFPQPKGNFSYASMIDKSMSKINWNKSAFEIHNQIRGLQNWPVASTVICGKNVKIHKSVLSDMRGNYAGEVVNNNKVLTVSCGDGKCLNILQIQPDGKKKMDISSFLSGNKVEIGTILGD